MRIDYIETFFFAATLGSIKEASQRVCVTHAAAGQRITQLENELGKTLLDRKGDSRVRLTAEGQRFLPEAEALITRWRRIKAEIGSGGWQTTLLRIGVIESVLHTWLLPWIASLEHEWPELQIELTVESTSRLGQLLRRAGLDLVVTTVPVVGERIRTQPLSTMSMVFAGSPQHHRHRAYPLSQLATSGLLTFQRGSIPHAALLDALRDAGIDSARVHAVSSISAMARMVSAGFGVATLPRATLRDPVVGPNLQALRCNTPLPALPIHASWRHDPTSEGLDAVVGRATEASAAATGGAGESSPRRKLPK